MLRQAYAGLGRTGARWSFADLLQDDLCQRHTYLWADDDDEAFDMTTSTGWLQTHVSR
jgi:hypothetical protein